MAKFKLPDGTVIEHYQTIYDDQGNPKKSGDGKRVLLKHVKGDAKYISQDTVVTKDGRTYRLLPPRWQEVSPPKPPDPALVVE